MSFQEALSLRSEFPECHLAYGRALEAVGRVREAIHHYLVFANDPAALDQGHEVLNHVEVLQKAHARREVTSERRAYRDGNTGELPVLIEM